MSYTLKKLLETYKVMIPQIQRDYAQGRENEFELRRGFVNKINTVLSRDGEKLNLDFIYGYTEKTGNDQVIFVPLDGQQRLTTLWLAHWLFAPRMENEIIQDVKVYLSKFTYETRMSSKRFCKALVNNILVINNEIAVSKQIVDAPWFMASWSNDPTVSAMLNMLDSLQAEFSDWISAWENLTKHDKITFDFIDIKSDEFKLTDELYIKMNSRGKPLTPFENFKAQFSGLLVSKETDYANITKEFNNAQVTYQQYFAFKIDSVWMDLFWSYRIKTLKNIDESIYRFINFVAEFLFFRENPDAVSGDVRMDFKFLNSVYAKKQNIDFLFNSLDFLSSLDDVSLFFDKLFDGLSTFDEYNNDYFLRAITNIGFEVKDRAILYAVLAVCNMTGTVYSGGQLKDYLRVVRNLLFTVRQPNQSKRIEFTTNLRLPNVSEYCRFIDAFAAELGSTDNKSVYQILSEKEFSGFSRDSIANEKIKGTLIVNNPELKLSIQRLEEHPDIQGNLSNFKLSTTDIERKIAAFLTVWDGSVSNSLIIRALLSVGDYSIMTHEYSSLGEIWYFGSSESWNRILTTGDKEERIQVSSVLDKFLSEFCIADGINASEKLQYMIDAFTAEERDWLYYFVKYRTMTDNPYRNQNLNLFTWQGEGFEINNLGNSGKQPLHSYHLNPYLTALRMMFADDQNLTLYWGRFTDSSYIKVANKIRIKCNRLGWEITPLEDFILDDEIIVKYNLDRINNTYILIETDDKDKIEVAVDFILNLLE